MTQKIFFFITMQTRNKAIALYKDILKLWGEIFISLKSCKNFVVGETLILKNVHNTLVCCARSLQKVYQIFIFTYFSTLFQSVGIKISWQRSWTLLWAEIKSCGLNFMVARGKVGVKQKNNFIIENCFIKQHVTVLFSKRIDLNVQTKKIPLTRVLS